jgi:hypothetical protein
VHGVRIHFFQEPPASAVGPSLLSGCIVGTGNDALKTHATNPPNQGVSVPCARRNALPRSWEAPGEVRLPLSRMPADAARAEEM